MMQDLFPAIKDRDTLCAQYARDITEKIRAGLEGVFQLIKVAYCGQAWSALGYASWDAYIQSEFGHLYLRPPREEREEIIGSLRDAGMSIRAIATATQLSRGTVSNELDGSGVQNWTPDHDYRSALANHFGSSPSTSAKDPQNEVRILGQDGKHYSATKPRPPESSSDSQAGLPESTSLKPAQPSESTRSQAADIESVLDSPAAEVGVIPLDMDERRSERDAKIRKLIKAFSNRDSGSLPRTLQLAEQISALVSPLSGEINVETYEYESLTKDISAAVRQFAYVAKTLSSADATFDSEQAYEIVVEDLRAALDLLRDSLHVVGSK